MKEKDNTTQQLQQRIAELEKTLTLYEHEDEWREKVGSVFISQYPRSFFYPEKKEELPHTKELVVMFTDLVGFTAMLESAGVPKMAEVLHHYFGDMDAIVHRYGGWIHKFNGDGMIILFGLREYSEGSQHGALYATKEMQERMKEYFTPTYGVEMRIGMERGEIVVDEIKTDHATRYDLLGESVNLASRLEKQSRTGGVLLGPTLCEMLVDDIQGAHTVDSLELKGVEGLVRVCHVQLDNVASAAQS